MDYDVIVIGAGIAGMSASVTLADNPKINILLLEKSEIGSNNPTPLTFLDTIKEHNLEDCIKERYSNFIVDNYLLSKITFNFNKDIIVSLDYKKACQKLFERICHNKNFSSKQLVVNDVLPTMDRVLVTTEDNRTFSAKIVIDASGKSQLAANKFHLTQHSYYSIVRGALYTDLRPLPKQVCAFLLPNHSFGIGGGWFYSIGKSSASFGYAHISDCPAIERNHAKIALQEARQRFDPYASYLHDAEVSRVENGVIPVSYIKKFYHGNILIIGDAAGMATNWACMGVEPALKYGKLAAILSIKAIETKNYDSLSSIQHIWMDENKKSYDMINKITPSFWNSSQYVWEWIIKNDLAFLSPEQFISRLRYNRFIIKKHKLLIRAISYKLSTLINKKNLKPKEIIIS